MNTEVKEFNDLDLSPRTYRVKPATLSEASKETIEEIRTTHGYTGDLAKFMITLPSRVDTYDDAIRQKGRFKTKKILYQKEHTRCQTSTRSHGILFSHDAPRNACRKQDNKFLRGI